LLSVEERKRENAFHAGPTEQGKQCGEGRWATSRIVGGVMLGPQPKINGKILSFTGPGIAD
jgi:hypothetical protein